MDQHSAVAPQTSGLIIGPDSPGPAPVGFEPAGAGKQTGCRVLIAIPFYKNAHLVPAVLNSLVACADDIGAIGAEVVCYNDSPDHAELHQALADQLPRMEAAGIPCRVQVNELNLGFVRTMNLAVAEAVARRADLLLLNSDTVVEAGTLPEMLAVAALDHMHGFVNPRSNNATLATLPLRTPPTPNAPGARAAYQALSDLLPRSSYVPTAVGFCLLIRWNILAEFGGFDEVYGQGYNEENDLVMRAGRCGYRAVLANRAFVWHLGEESFSSASVSRATLEPANRAILDARYPEYAGYTVAHYHAPETTAEHLLAATLPDADGKLNIAFDFSSFRAAHNGTFQAGRQLLEVASRVWGEQFSIHVVCVEEVYAFHDYAALGMPRADPHGGARFAAIFRVGQPYDWNVLERLAPSAAVVGVYMLDPISVDCPQLATPLLTRMWQFTLDHADVIATQSRQTQRQFRLRFRIPPTAIEVVSLHGLDLAEYRLPGTDTAASDTSQVLVLGNHFHHKFLNPTVNALAAAFPDRTVVAMGPNGHGAAREAGPMDPAPLDDRPNLRILAVGDLTDVQIGAEYAAADVVVFPSHAEGFGFPLLHALAAERPVMVRRLPVFEEIWHALGEPPNMHFYESTAHLVETLRTPPLWQAWTAPAADNGAERSAREIKAALDTALAAVGYDRIVSRLGAVQLAAQLASHAAMPPASDTKAAQAARYFALRVERVTLLLLRLPVLYAGFRVLFRAARGAWRALYRRFA
jgi:GT2 family glycosyltransferase